MLGNDGSAWLERLHMQLARNLKAADWSQAEIASILGSTQSTVSRMAHRDLPHMSGTSDESTIDGWAHEISMALRQLVQNPNLVVLDLSWKSHLLPDKSCGSTNLSRD